MDKGEQFKAIKSCFPHRECGICPFKDTQIRIARIGHESKWVVNAGKCIASRPEDCVIFSTKDY